MRIVCENCNAVYSIAEKIIGTNGRIVKCAKCFHSWKVVLNYQENKADTIKQVYKEPRNIWLKLFIIFLFFILASSVFLIFSRELIKYKSFKPFYEKLSIHDYNDIKLNDCSFEVENDDIIINASITNHSNEDKQMPIVQYTLFNKNKKIVFSYMIEPKNPVIKAGETLSIDNRIESIDQPVKYLKIKIGNKLDFFFAR